MSIEGENPFLYVRRVHCSTLANACTTQRTSKKYEGKYNAGWDEIRKQRYQRMIDMGLIKEAMASLTEAFYISIYLGGIRIEGLACPMHGSVCSYDRQHGPGHWKDKSILET
jgi:hypothetical protein